MGRIIVTLAGPWSNPPQLRSALDLSFEPGAPEFAEDVAVLGRNQGTFDRGEIKALRAHTGLVLGEAEFDDPGGLDMAEAAARLMLDGFAAEGLAAFVETGMRVYARGALRGIRPRDPATLLHLLVGVFTEAAVAFTEGMCAFDLPDVRVEDAADPEAAQAAAFGVAARMVCEGWRPEEGGRYQNTLSAPEYRVRRVAADPDDELANARGGWHLEREA